MSVPACRATPQVMFAGALPTAKARFTLLGERPRRYLVLGLYRPRRKMPEQLGGFGIAGGILKLRRPTDERKMNQPSAARARPPAISRAPARFADPTRARQVAQAFDVRQLPDDYY